MMAKRAMKASLAVRVVNAMTMRVMVMAVLAISWTWQMLNGMT